ncbi:MAG: sodium-dependent transporter [Bacteroidetes bacterium]|nr:sodium-dependent transporter [Bacteroidota bacterium]
MPNLSARESWGTRFGLIFAVAGNAIGLGNFLRFPVQAAENGGGSFMIPYIIAFLLIGIPLMWMEWTIGRYGGRYGHGTTPGMFARLWNHPAAKYLGVLGLIIPFIVLTYYVFIESWTFAYSVFSLTGLFGDYMVVNGGSSSELSLMKDFLLGYTGQQHDPFFWGIGMAAIFLGITLVANFWILYKGLSGGIEWFAKWALPTLFIFAIILVIRIFTLDQIPGSNGTVWQGLGYIWNPDYSRLGDVNVWLAAAGQIFFTLSVGMGTIHTYASYLRSKEDIALNGLATGMTNEFAEIVLGVCIAIPVAVLFFGLSETITIAQGGSFNLGFVSMSVIFNHIEFGPFFGFIWFFLLFFAGITSSVAMGQPIVTFLQEELKWSHRKSVTALLVLTVGCVIPVLLFSQYGYLDELDFWAGTFLLVLFGTIECILLAWVFGMDKTWAEMNLGAAITIPRIFYFIIKWVTPLFLIALLAVWFFNSAWGILIFANEDNPDKIAAAIGARLFIVVIFVAFSFLVYRSWKSGTHRELK